MDAKISDKTINRLTLYHCILTDCIRKETDSISSTTIAGLLRIDDSQVRKDISLLNNSGKSRVGYDVVALKKAIEHKLAYSKVKNVFIVGAGNLGFALAKYNNFANYGLNILALFDNNPLKHDVTIGDKKVYPLEDLKGLAKEMDVDIAILTVPYDAAQAVTDYMVEAGIKYIWNFAPVVLDVPSDVQVWNENLMGNFLQFTYNK